MDNINIYAYAQFQFIDMNKFVYFASRNLIWTLWQ